MHGVPFDNDPPCLCEDHPDYVGESEPEEEPVEEGEEGEDA